MHMNDYNISDSVLLLFIYSGMYILYERAIERPQMSGRISIRGYIYINYLVFYETNHKILCKYVPEN